MTCSRCKGVGEFTHPKVKPEFAQCPDCNGTGKVPEPIAMKDLEALGWQIPPDGIARREYCFGNYDSAILTIRKTTVIIEPWMLGRNGISIEAFPTLDLALNAANALACCTPDNPKGRWVE